MLDLKFVRANPDIVQEAVKNKNERLDFSTYTDSDQRRRDLLKEVEGLKNQRNTESQAIAEMKRNQEDASVQIAAMREVSAHVKTLDTELAKIEADIQEILTRIPNIPHESVPSTLRGRNGDET